MRSAPNRRNSHTTSDRQPESDLIGCRDHAGSRRPRLPRQFSQTGNHGDGAWSGGAGHAGHDGGGDPSGTAADSSGPTLFDALQRQLGLRLVPAEQALARLFVIDRVAQRPTEN